MVVTAYTATLTYTHAVVLIRVLTVETGMPLVAEEHCYFMVTYMSSMKVSESTCVVGTMLTHQVYAVVLLRPVRSVVGRLSMWDCIPVEVSVNVYK